MENRKNWYLISTKTGCEVKVAQVLERIGMASYVPVLKQFVELNIKKRIGPKILFPSFVFVFATEQDHIRIRKVDGVLSIMFWLNKPVVIKSEEIMSIRNFLNSHSNIKVEKLNIGQSAQYMQNTNNNIFGIEEETKRLFLFSIGYTLAATLTIPELLEVA